jgi:1,2-phenylacetyl-CoA epoxidase catalytic subunit
MSMDDDEVTPQSEESLVRYLSGGGKLGAPDNATPRYRGELMRLMAVFVDSELAGASGFADCINQAPGVKERLVAARIVQDKFGHADKVLRVMEGFGTNVRQYVAAHNWSARLERNTDLGSRRHSGDMRLNVFHYPIEGWLDAAVMNTLMGHASLLQLDDLAKGSYQPFVDMLEEIMPVETKHAELAVEGVRKALSEDFGAPAAQASVDYWYPRVAATFGRAASERSEAYRKYALRERSNEELLAAWRNDARTRLLALGLRAPEELR